MNKKSKMFIATLASFFGTTIGVGIFALPYAYDGAFISSLLVLIGTALILTSLYAMYIEILVEKGIGIHQLPGIVGKIWNKRMKNIVAIILLFGRTGIMFLYTLILADFGTLVLDNVFNLEVSPYLVAGVTTFLGSYAITRQVRFMSRLELYFSAMIISIIGITSIFGISSSIVSDPSIIKGFLTHDAILTGESFWESMRSLGTIYGVTIGALSGIAGIPALKGITKDKSVLVGATRVGSSLVVILYALFALLVITSSGEVSQDALHGLGDAWWVTLLAFAGFISVLTSYLGVGFSLFEVYQKDYSIPTFISWLLTFLPPFTLYMIGVDNFVDVAAIVGGIIGGTEGLIILASYWKIESQQKVFPLRHKILAILTAIVLMIGLILTV